MRRRSRPSPALRLAVRAGAAGAVGAAVAVPLLRRRLRIPAPVTVAACAGGPAGARRAAARARSKRDVALFAMQMWAFTMVHELPYDDPERLRAPAPHPLPDRRRPRDRRRPAAQRPPAARAWRGCRGSASLNRVLTWTHWLWFFEPYVRAGLDPRPPPRALPARRPPDGRGLRPRLRRLLRGADRAALVGLRAGPDRRRGAADHGRGRRGRPGARPGRRCTTRSAATPGRRCPRCTSPPRWSAALSLAEAGKVEGAVGWAYALARSASPSSTSASTTSPTCSPGRPWSPSVRRGEPLAEPARARGQRRPAAPGEDRERVASQGCLRRDPANGERPTRRDCRCSPRGGSCRRSSSSSSCSVAIYFLFPKLVGLGDALSKLDEADPLWIAIAIGFNVARLSRPTSPSSRRSSAATRCA